MNAQNWLLNSMYKVLMLRCHLVSVLRMLRDSEMEWREIRGDSEIEQQPNPEVPTMRNS